jgi:hypothetical protein
LDICNLGKTTKNDSLIIKNKNNKIIKLKINAMKKFWTTGFVDALK